MNSFVGNVIKAVGSKIGRFFRMGDTSKYRKERKKLTKTLVKSAVNMESFEARALQQKDVSGDTMLRQLHGAKEGFSLAKSLSKEIIDSAKKARTFPRNPMIAIDCKDIAYFGKANSFALIGSNQCKGTDKVIREAVVSLADSNGSLVLGAEHVYQYSRMENVLERLFEQAEKHFAKFVRALLDRGFFSHKNIDMMNRRNQEFLMLAPENSKIFFVKKKIKGKEHVLSVATNAKSFVPEALASFYPMRWLVETCHREVDKFRIRTTSNDFFMRHFFFLFACLLYNLWLIVRIDIRKSYGERAVVRGYVFRTKIIDMLEQCSNFDAKAIACFY